MVLFLAVGLLAVGLLGGGLVVVEFFPPTAQDTGYCFPRAKGEIEFAFQFFPQEAPNCTDRCVSTNGFLVSNPDAECVKCSSEFTYSINGTDTMSIKFPTSKGIKFRHFWSYERSKDVETAVMTIEFLTVAGETNEIPIQLTSSKSDQHSLKFPYTQAEMRVQSSIQSMHDLRVKGCSGLGLHYDLEDYPRNDKKRHSNILIFTKQY